MEIVGRERVIDEVVRRLGEARLVTITGPGGIGKTTIADTVASLDPERYPLGVRRVDLTMIDDPAEVGSALAAQLGFGSFRALLDSPTDEPALVVVDNCEHVLGAVADAVAALLDACRSPTVLATSRSPLGVTGESVVVLGPLELPGPDGDERGSAAVQLFLQRASETGAVVPDDEIAAVAHVCRVLDGVPLAIELAAARSRVLSPSELLERLGDLDVLRRSRARGPLRHRSVRDTIAWSYDLMDDGDRGFFDRVSVMSGPFTVDDAHAVAGDGSPVATVDRLDRLVADSLLATSVIAGSTFHRQLDLVRSYARERLVESGGWDVTWQRFVDRVTERSIELVASTTAGWDRTSLAALVGRVDQHLAVLRWCLERDDWPARSFILVSTLWGVVHQGRLGDIAPLAERAIERWDDPSLPGWGDAAATTATCRYLAGRPEEAIELAWRALEHAGDSIYAPCTLRRVVGHARVALGDLDGAIAILSEAIEVATDRVPALALEMTVSRAEIMATAAGRPLGTEMTDELLSAVRGVAAEAAATGSAVNEIWARSVEASILARTEPARARDVATAALAAAGAAAYPAAESVNLHTLASILVDAGDCIAAAGLVRRHVDGLVARGAESELRNALRMAAVVLERARRPEWETIAATADALPVVSLFSVPGHERHVLPAVDQPPTDVRAAVTLARRELDALSVQRSLEVQVRAASDDPIDHLPGAVDDAPSNVWALDGDVWTISFDALTVRMGASKGLADIARLLAAPGAEVHCIELAGVVVEDRSSGEVIDARARREYEHRVRELQSEIDGAEADADYHRADRARAELDAIVDHLTAALGLGGRARRHTDGVERARSAVTQRIRTTIKRLRTVHPSLAAHLDASVQTGTYCSYRPERPTTWSTAGPGS